MFAMFERTKEVETRGIRTFEKHFYAQMVDGKNMFSRADSAQNAQNLTSAEGGRRRNSDVMHLF